MNHDAPGNMTAAELRARAEAAFGKRSTGVAGSGPDALPLDPDATQALLHELQVHQIELEMQNDELRRVQGETQTWREHYFDLYELAPVGYCTVSEQGRVLGANLTLATLAGVSRQAIVGQSFARLILPEDQDAFYLMQRRVLAVEPEDARG